MSDVTTIEADVPERYADAVSKRLTLHKGPNIIRCAIFNAGGATDFCARFLGPDEKPLKNFTVRLNEVAEKKP